MDEKLSKWLKMADQCLDIASIPDDVKQIPVSYKCHSAYRFTRFYLIGFLGVNEHLPPDETIDDCDLAALLRLCEEINAGFSELKEKITCLMLFDESLVYPGGRQVSSDDLKLAIQYAKDIQKFVKKAVGAENAETV